MSLINKIIVCLGIASACAVLANVYYNVSLDCLGVCCASSVGSVMFLKVVKV